MMCYQHVNLMHHKQTFDAVTLSARAIVIGLYPETIAVHGGLLFLPFWLLHGNGLLFAGLG